MLVLEFECKDFRIIANSLNFSDDGQINMVLKLESLEFDSLSYPTIGNL